LYAQDGGTATLGEGPVFNVPPIVPVVPPKDDTPAQPIPTSRSIELQPDAPASPDASVPTSTQTQQTTSLPEASSDSQAETNKGVQQPNAEEPRSGTTAGASEPDGSSDSINGSLNISKALDAAYDSEIKMGQLLDAAEKAQAAHSNDSEGAPAQKDDTKQTSTEESPQPSGDKANIPTPEQLKEDLKVTVDKEDTDHVMQMYCITVEDVGKNDISYTIEWDDWTGHVTETDESVQGKPSDGDHTYFDAVKMPTNIVISNVKFIQ
jgi:hypothetical protein